MKRCLLTFFMCVSIMNLHALTHYSIYEWKGEVQYKLYGEKQWLPATKNVQLTIVDSVRIGKNSYVRLIDQTRHNSIRSLSEGVFTINHILAESAAVDSKSNFASINHELVNKKMSAYRPSSMSTQGAKMRDVISSTDIPAKKLWANSFSFIGNQAINGQLNKPTQGLILHKKICEEGITFAIENSTDKDYYANVLHVYSLTGIASLCFIIEESNLDTRSIMLPHGCCYTFSDLVFPNTEDDYYILVATEVQYDTKEVNDELLYHNIHNASDSELIILYAL